MREQIYFISTNLGSDDDGNEDAKGDRGNDNKDDDVDLRVELATEGHSNKGKLQDLGTNYWL